MLHAPSGMCFRFADPYTKGGGYETVIVTRSFKGREGEEEGRRANSPGLCSQRI